MLAFRSAFEKVLLREQGHVNEWEAKLLRTASKAYGAALRVDNILARAGRPGESLEHGEYMAYLDRSVKFEQECDRALKALGIDRRQNAGDVFDALYRSTPGTQGAGNAGPVAHAVASCVPLATDEQTPAPTPDAAEAKLGDSSGGPAGAAAEGLAEDDVTECPS